MVAARQTNRGESVASFCLQVPSSKTNSHPYLHQTCSISGDSICIRIAIFCYCVWGIFVDLLLVAFLDFHCFSMISMFSHVFLSFLCLFCFSLPFISFHCFSVVAPAFLALPAFLCLSCRPSLVFPCFFLLLIAFLLLVLFWRIVHCFNGFRLLWRLLPLLFIAFLMFHTFPSLALCFLVCHFTLMDNPSASYEQSSFILAPLSIMIMMYLSHAGLPGGRKFCLLPCGPDG